MNTKEALVAVLCLTASIMSVAGCSKDNIVQLDQSTLTSDKMDLVVQKYDDEVAFSLNWSSVRGASSYFVQFTSDKDPEFLRPVVFSVENSTSLEMTYSDLECIHNTAGVFSDYQLIARVLVEGENRTSSYSNKIRIDVSFDIWPMFDIVYLCGDGTPGGWNAGNVPSVYMKAQNNKMYDIYTWEGRLIGGGDVRINTQKDWFPSVMLNVNTNKAQYLSSADYYANVDSYAHFTVATTGDYRITFDARDFKNLLVNIEPI